MNIKERKPFSKDILKIKDIEFLSNKIIEKLKKYD